MLISFILGITFFFVTGIDDLAVLILLTKNSHKQGRISVSLGTLLAVIVMFLMAYFSAMGISRALGHRDWFKFFGLGPIIIGFYFLKKNYREPEKNLVYIQNWKLFLVSFSVYILNMADDFLVNAGYLSTLFLTQNSDWVQMSSLMLLLGNLTGAFLMIYLASLISDSKKIGIQKMAKYFPPIILIFVGLKILIF